MRKALVGLTIAGASLGALIPASSAGATTCEISDPGVEDVVCVIVYDPVVRAACTALEKVKVDCFQ
ncbi:MAG: hypothetical protein ACRDLB_06515 [Actinomycetota bacterium]